MIRATDIQYSYDGIRKLELPDVHCASGESCIILGPSGSGKTTLLHILSGLLQPTTGSVNIAGKDIFAMSQRELRQWRGNTIGMLFQVPHFIAALTMKENMLLTQSLAGRKKHPREVEDYFNELEMGHRIDAKPSELSQGELQRASLVRSIINEPAVILADEPTSALDDANTEKVISLLKRMGQQNGSALVIVTHDQRIKDAVDHQITLK